MDNSNSRIALVCRHQAAGRKPTFRSNSGPPRFQAAYFSLQLVSLLAVSVGCSCNVQVQRCRVGKRFSSGPRDLPDSQTDKCKISINYYDGTGYTLSSKTKKKAKQCTSCTSVALNRALSKFSRTRGFRSNRFVHWKLERHLPFDRRRQSAICDVLQVSHTLSIFYTAPPCATFDCLSI